MGRDFLICMKKKEIKDLLEVFLTLQVTKELPRQGFLYSGFKRNEADSVAAHSFSVVSLSYLLARELRKRGMQINVERVFNIALFHDMGEAITGDIGTYVKDLAGVGVFDDVEKKAFSLLMRNMTDTEELMGFFLEYQKLETTEAQIVKMADALDALVQGLNTPGANMSDWESKMHSIGKNKLKSEELSQIFLDCVEMLFNKEVTYFRGHIAHDDPNQTKL
jgi:putative hydrolases of HD superfamily